MKSLSIFVSLYKDTAFINKQSTQSVLKSLGPIDHNFNGHRKNDGFVLHEYIIKQRNSFCKYTNISDIKKHYKKPKENNMLTVNRKYVMFMGNAYFFLISFFWTSSKL